MIFVETYHYRPLATSLLVHPSYFWLLRGRLDFHESTGFFWISLFITPGSPTHWGWWTYSTPWWKKFPGFRSMNFCHKKTPKDTSQKKIVKRRTWVPVPKTSSPAKSATREAERYGDIFIESDKIHLGKVFLVFKLPTICSFLRSRAYQSTGGLLGRRSRCITTAAMRYSHDIQTWYTRCVWVT